MRIILYGTTAGCEKVRTYLDDFELHIYTHMEQLIQSMATTSSWCCPSATQFA